MEDQFLEFECVWTIEKHILLNPYIISVVETPEFEVPSFPLTKWILGYHLKEATEENSLRIFLKRSSNDSGERIVSVRFKLFIMKGNDVLACNIDNVSSTSFDRGRTSISIIDVSNLLTSLTNDLTIKCQFFASTCNDSRKTMNIEVLSKDINNLFENEIIPDITLKNRNTIEKVHKSVLWARCPSLLKFENQEDLDINPNTLKLLLHYIYTGYLDTYTSDIPLDLSIIAKKYKIASLQRCINITPSKLCVNSRVHEYITSYTWVIKNLNERKSNEEVFSPLINLCGNKTQWKLAAYHRIASDWEEVEVRLKCVSTETDSPVLLQCKITATLLGGEEISNTSFSHFFHAGENYVIFSNRKRKELFTVEKIDVSLENSLLLKCVLSLSDGTVSNTVSELFSKSEESKTINYQIFANDLKRLFLETEVSDVTLVVGDRKFPTHKAILAARSPVFTKMFQTEMAEKSTHKLTITDVESATMFSFLKYIYTAEVELGDGVSVSELYIVADKYEVLVLKEKCALYLKSNLNSENFKDVFIVADMHCDEALKTAIKNFICDNANKILDKDEWKNLIESRPRLANEVLHALSIKYAGILSCGDLNECNTFGRVCSCNAACTHVAAFQFSPAYEYNVRSKAELTPANTPVAPLKYCRAVRRIIRKD